MLEERVWIRHTKLLKEDKINYKEQGHLYPQNSFITAVLTIKCNVVNFPLF
jgi:hypothetical protein